MELNIDLNKTQHLSKTEMLIYSTIPNDGIKGMRYELGFDHIQIDETSVYYGLNINLCAKIGLLGSNKADTIYRAIKSLSKKGLIDIQSSVRGTYFIRKSERDDLYSSVKDINK